MIAETFRHRFRIAGGGDDVIALCQSLFGDQGAKTAGCTSDEPCTHFEISCWLMPFR